MTSNTLKKVLAGSAMAALLLPMAASAHGIGLNFGGGLGLGFGGDKEKSQVEGNGKVNVHANAKVGDGNRGRDGDRDDRDDNREVKAKAHASTTATGITKVGNRIKLNADILGSVGATLESKLSALGTTSAAVTTATVDYKAQLIGAKTQAQAAIDAAATINASSTASTTASIIDQAKASLKAARDFLAAARADIMVMFKFLVRQ